MFTQCPCVNTLNDIYTKLLPSERIRKQPNRASFFFKQWDPAVDPESPVPSLIP